MSNYLALGWPRTEHYRTATGHWRCNDCDNTWTEESSGRGTFNEDDFLDNECDECSSNNTTLVILDDQDLDDDLVDDLGFSWSQCDVCGSTLGGNRYAVSDISEDGSECVPMEACQDCYIEIATGERPE